VLDGFIESSAACLKVVLKILSPTVGSTVSFLPFSAPAFWISLWRAKKAKAAVFLLLSPVKALSFH